MRNGWKRFGVLIGVMAVVTAGALTLGAPHVKNHPQPCPQPGCTDTCDPSTQVAISCQDGKKGTPYTSTFACCCCNANAGDRYYIGPK